MPHQKRYRVLPEEGRLIVSTDLHGNWEDFRALSRVFYQAMDDGDQVHWVLLGDLVHGPDRRARLDEPTLYDFSDKSWEIVEGVIQLVEEYPDNVHLVLGNHDHGHIGGPRPAKFYPDEAAHLEATLNPFQLAVLRDLFESALLMVLAPCGLLLAHGSPDDSLENLQLLDELSFDPLENDPMQNAILRTFLTSYGQLGTVTDRLLKRVSESSGLDLGVVVHGHDRDLDGWFSEGGNQLCPVIFGATREKKRYLHVDLSARYHRVEDLRDEIELRRLHSLSARNRLEDG